MKASLVLIGIVAGFTIPEDAGRYPIYGFIDPGGASKPSIWISRWKIRSPELTIYPSLFFLEFSSVFALNSS
jgi:hypothetical protein